MDYAMLILLDQSTAVIIYRVGQEMKTCTQTHRYAPSAGLIQLCRCQYRTTLLLISHVSLLWWSRSFFASIQPWACWPGCKQLSWLPPLRFRWSGPLPLTGDTAGPAAPAAGCELVLDVRLSTHSPILILNTFQHAQHLSPVLMCCAG